MTGKYKRLLLDKEGNGIPLAAAVTLALLMLILVIMQFARLMIVSAGVKDAMQEAIISTINDIMQMYTMRCARDMPPDISRQTVRSRRA